MKEKIPSKKIKIVGLIKLTVFIFCLSSFVDTSMVFAHKVNVFAFVQGNSLVVEGYFSGKSRARDCLVKVFDSSGTMILECKTDSQGTCVFDLGNISPDIKSVKVSLEAEMGHKAEYTVELKDQGSNLSKAASNESKMEDPAPTTGNDNKDQARDIPLNPDALIQTFNAMMDKKLDPLYKMLGNQEKLLLEQSMAGPKMTEIIGGIGWIVGIAGIAAFFMSKKRKSTR